MTEIYKATGKLEELTSDTDSLGELSSKDQIKVMTNL